MKHIVCTKVDLETYESSLDLWMLYVVFIAYIMLLNSHFTASLHSCKHAAI